jgi:D-alanyl-D-alanine carboxypeptidase
MRRTAILVAGLALLATACLPAEPPPPPENGRLPDSMLTTITPECRVVNDIAFGLNAMLWDANAQGVNLWPETSSYLPPDVYVPRIESCYRSYDMQVWWHDWYCSIGNCGMAAVPGTSVHGWGRAVDFQDQFGELTFDSPGYQWLVANAWRYGFVHPAWAEPGSSNAEAWHWEAP